MDKIKIEKINNKNATYQKLEVLKTNRNKRHKYGEFLVEGVNNIKQAAANNWEFTSFIYVDELVLSDWAKETINTTKTDVNYELSMDLMKDLSGKENTSEILAIVKMKKANLSTFKSKKNPLIVLFDRPSNMGNLGTIIRSCDCFGIDGIIITGHAVDVYAPEVITASMGSFFSVPIFTIPSNNGIINFIDGMKNIHNDFQVIGTTAHKETTISQVNFKKPTLICIGNETNGLSYGLKETCHTLATIPLNKNSTATSFNVSCAATVIFYEAVSQRGDLDISN